MNKKFDNIKPAQPAVFFCFVFLNKNINNTTAAVMMTLAV